MEHTKTVKINKTVYRVVSTEFAKKIGYNALQFNLETGKKSVKKATLWYSEELKNKKYVPYFFTTEKRSCGSWLKYGVSWLPDDYKEEKKERYQSSAAMCAKDIRIELKKEFPGVKFSVRSSNFSMGNSVDVSWTDGPSKHSVEDVTNKYQYGSFNGMEDIYEHTNSRDDLNQTKWLSNERKLSDKESDRMKQEVIDTYVGMEGCTLENINSFYNKEYGEYGNVLFHRYVEEKQNELYKLEQSAKVDNVIDLNEYKETFKEQQKEKEFLLKLFNIN